MKAFVLFALILFASVNAHCAGTKTKARTLSTSSPSMQTWIVAHDSILSYVAQGTAAQHALTLVSVERNVIFRPIGSIGSTLGGTDKTGFNSDEVVKTMRRIGGGMNAYHGVLVELGTNDFHKSIPFESTQNGLRLILDEVRLSGKKALVLDPIWRYNETVPNVAGNTLDGYRWSIWAVCSQEYGDVCRYAHRSGTVMGSSAGSALYDSAEVASGTQVHPNVTGHRKLADWIKAEATKAGYF